jgi:hypothetical protein
MVLCCGQALGKMFWMTYTSMNGCGHLCDHGSFKMYSGDIGLSQNDRRLETQTEIWRGKQFQVLVLLC